MMFVILNSLPGAYYHSEYKRKRQSSSHGISQLIFRFTVGFPVVNRMIWGMWGSQFVIWNRIFLSLG